MDTKDILKKVRKIEIKTRGISRDIFSGEYHSVFKGRGMAFSEVRDYQFGDDIRAIDWNVTARFSHPFIKVFEEERELTVVFLIDVSDSESFGAKGQFKKELIMELCAVLAFSASQNNDKVGAVFFSGKIEKFIPPKKGKSHVLRIIREIIDFKPEGKGTNIAEALRYLLNVMKKRAIVFIISDFFDAGYENALAISARRHDTIALRISDAREEELPKAGLIKLSDAETGDIFWADTSKRQFREDYKNWALRREKALKALFNKTNVDEIKINTGQSYIAPLINFFRARAKRK